MKASKAEQQKLDAETLRMENSLNKEQFRDFNLSKLLFYFILKG